MNSKLRKPTNIRMVGKVQAPGHKEDVVENLKAVTVQENEKDAERDTACTVIELDSDLPSPAQEIGEKVQELEPVKTPKRAKDPYYDHENVGELIPEDMENVSSYLSQLNIEEEEIPRDEQEDNAKEQLNRETQTSLKTLPKHEPSQD